MRLRLQRAAASIMAAAERVGGLPCEARVRERGPSGEGNDNSRNYELQITKGGGEGAALNRSESRRAGTGYGNGEDGYIRNPGDQEAGKFGVRNSRHRGEAQCGVTERALNRSEQRERRRHSGCRGEDHGWWRRKA